MTVLAPSDPKIGADLITISLMRGWGNIDERTVTICSGTDFVQISHTNITGADSTTAKVRSQSQFEYSNMFDMYF